VTLPEELHFSDLDTIKNKCGSFYKSGVPTQLGAANPMFCELLDDKTVMVSDLFFFGQTPDTPTV
jgi:hypothetical protein